MVRSSNRYKTFEVDQPTGRLSREAVCGIDLSDGNSTKPLEDDCEAAAMKHSARSPKKVLSCSDGGTVRFCYISPARAMSTVTPCHATASYSSGVVACHAPKLAASEATLTATCQPVTTGALFWEEAADRQR